MTTNDLELLLLYKLAQNKLLKSTNIFLKYGHLSDKRFVYLVGFYLLVVNYRLAC